MLEPIEVWLPVNNLEGVYEVSDKGAIRSVDRKILQKNGYRVVERFCRGTLVKPVVVRGYKKVSLSNGRTIKKKLVSVHRIVATGFLPNPLGLPQVNHKDGNKLNNTVNNLEWCTPSGNILHAFAHGLSKRSNRIKVKNVKTGEVFDSITEAAKTIGKSDTMLRKYLSGESTNTTDLRYEDKKETI